MSTERLGEKVVRLERALEDAITQIEYLISARHRSSTLSDTDVEALRLHIFRTKKLLTGGHPIDAKEV